MRLVRKLRHTLRMSLAHRRGYRPSALRPGHACPHGLAGRIPAGGIIVGPFGARKRAVDVIRREIAAGSYVNDWRLEAALERLAGAL